MRIHWGMMLALSVACGGSSTTRTESHPRGAGHRNISSEAGGARLVITHNHGAQEELRIEGDGTIRTSGHENEGITGALAAIELRLTANGELVYDGEPFARLRDDGEIEMLRGSLPPLGVRVRDDGALLRGADVIAEFDSNGLLVTKLEHDEERVVVHGDRSSRRRLMFVWAMTLQPAELAGWAPPPQPNFNEVTHRIAAAIGTKAKLPCDGASKTAIHGIITESPGTPVEGASVVAVSDDGRKAEFVGLTDKKGCYLLELPPGPYRVVMYYGSAQTELKVTLAKDQKVTVNGSISPAN